MARRLMPYATDMGAAVGRALPAAGASIAAAAPFLVWPTNTQSVGTIDLGDGLRTNLPPGQRYVPIERRVAPGVFGSDVGAIWKQIPGLYGEVDPGRGVLVDPDRLREALGDEAANRILNTPGIMPMAKRRPGRRIPRYPRDQSTAGSGGDRPPEEPAPPAEAIVDQELRRLARQYQMQEKSETTQRILRNLNMPFREYTRQYIQGRVTSEIPSEILDGTARDVLESGNSAALKALKQGRFSE